MSRQNGWLLIAVLAALFVVAPAGWAADEGQVLEGSGYGVYDTPSIKGFDENKINKDPVCDRNRRPKISKVEPDEAKPGDKVVIKGENFGTKECFQGVTFSSAGSGTPVKFKYVDENTIEVIVPDARSGMGFVVVVAGGGSSQKPVLIKGK